MLLSSEAAIHSPLSDTGGPGGVLSDGYPPRNYDAAEIHWPLSDTGGLAGCFPAVAPSISDEG